MSIWIWGAIPFMIWIFIEDLRHQMIPNIALLLITILGLISALMQIDEALSFITAAFLCSGLFLGLRAYFLFKRNVEALGLGDIYFAFAVGVWLSPFQLPLFLMLSSLSGLLYFLWLWLRKKQDIQKQRIPFAPFMIVAFWCVFLSTKPF